jgi:hypothetical protein
MVFPLQTILQFSTDTNWVSYYSILKFTRVSVTRESSDKGLSFNHKSICHCASD